MPAYSQEKHALIIGNGNYLNVPKLKNPVNDARAVAKALRLKQLGFKVTELHNRSLHQMENAIREFGNKVPAGSIAMVYFSGHGVQYQGDNYLLPVDFLAQFEDQLPRRSISTSDVMSKLAKNVNGLNIVVLDACRDNPLQTQFKSASRGLKRIENTPPNTFTIYATAEGRVASDNPREQNGLFTKYFVQNLTKPGLDLSSMMLETRRAVVKASKGAQVPYETGSLTERFCFAGCGASNIATQAKKTGKELFDLAEKESNLSKAMSLYKQAAINGHKPAFNYIDELYALPHGEFIKPKSPELFTDLGYIMPYDLIGNPDLKGNEVHEVLHNEKSAIVWYQKAAQLGYVRANYILALISSSGSQRKRKSPESMFHLVKKASDKKSTEATALLALFYFKGTGVKRSKEKAENVIKQGLTFVLEQGTNSINSSISDNLTNWWYVEKLLTPSEQEAFEAMMERVSKDFFQERFSFNQ